MNREILISSRLRERTQHLCDLMYRLTGTNPVAELRVRRVVTARVLVAYALMNDGYSEHEIGCVLGWDHSTINHYRKKMKTFMEAPGYDAERELWDNFKNAI